MWRWAQVVLDWIFSRHSSLVQLSLQAPNTGGLSRGRRGFDPPNHPYDPASWVRAPNWHGPAGRSASAAVAEPVDDESVVAVGVCDLNPRVAGRSDRRT